MEEKSIFQKILDKEIESEIIYEDDKIFSIKDLYPWNVKTLFLNLTPNLTKYEIGRAHV